MRDYTKHPLVYRETREEVAEAVIEPRLLFVIIVIAIIGATTSKVMDDAAMVTETLEAIETGTRVELK